MGILTQGGFSLVCARVDTCQSDFTGAGSRRHVTVLALALYRLKGCGKEYHPSTRSIFNIDAPEGNSEDIAYWPQGILETHSTCAIRKCDKAERRPGTQTRMSPHTDTADAEEWVPTAKVLCFRGYY